MTFLLTLSSCAVYQGYQAKLITEDAVARELQPKSLNFLRIQASQINHPTPLWRELIQIQSPKRLKVILLEMSPPRFNMDQS